MYRMVCITAVKYQNKMFNGNNKQKEEVANSWHLCKNCETHNNSLYCLPVYSHVVKVQKHAYE